jgi:hypothetical protein
MLARLVPAQSLAMLKLVSTEVADKLLLEALVDFLEVVGHLARCFLYLV